MHIRLFICCCVCFLLVPGGVCAQSLYVADVQEITVRTGPTLENKIVQMLKSGAKLEKIKEEGDWLQVRTDTGKEGWVLKRFVTLDTPVRAQFEEFKVKNAELIDKAGKVESIVGRFEEENKHLQKSLAALQLENAKIKNEYENLSQANANVADLAKKYQDLKNSFESTRQDMDRIKRENETLRDLSDVKWFLAGAGVFFGGWIFGYLLGRSARKKSNRMYV